MSWLDVVREQAATVPSAHVIAFGTNDAAQQAGAPTTADRDNRRWATFYSMDASIRATRQYNASACIVFVTVSEKYLSNGQPLTNFTDEAGRVNTLLKAFRDSPSHGTIRVADWASAVRTHCASDWLTNASRTCDYFTDDQMHLTRKGEEARNALIVDAVSRCYL